MNTSGRIFVWATAASLLPLVPAAAQESGAGSIEALHLLFEASRLAYADRNEYLADNEKLAGEDGLSPAEVIAGLLNPAYLDARAELIDPMKAAENVEAGDPSAFAPTLNSVSFWKMSGLM